MVVFLGWKHPGLIEAIPAACLSGQPARFLGWKHPGLIEAVCVWSG